MFRNEFNMVYNRRYQQFFNRFIYIIDDSLQALAYCRIAETKLCNYRADFQKERGFIYRHAVDKSSLKGLIIPALCLHHIGKGFTDGIHIIFLFPCEELHFDGAVALVG